MCTVAGTLISENFYSTSCFFGWNRKVAFSQHFVLNSVLVILQDFVIVNFSALVTKTVVLYSFFVIGCFDTVWQQLGI